MQESPAPHPHCKGGRSYRGPGTFTEGGDQKNDRPGRTTEPKSNKQEKPSKKRYSTSWEQFQKKLQKSPIKTRRIGEGKEKRHKSILGENRRGKRAESRKIKKIALGSFYLPSKKKGETRKSKHRTRNTSNWGKKKKKKEEKTFANAVKIKNFRLLGKPWSATASRCVVTRQGGGVHWNAIWKGKFVRPP